MTRLHLTLAVLAIGGAETYAACSNTTPEPEKQAEVAVASRRKVEPEPSATSPAEESPPAGAGGGAAAYVEDVAWDAPSTWTSMPNANTMRKATYKIAKAGGDAEDAELTVTAAAGGVDANVTRWAGQFGNVEPKKELRT